MKKTLLTVYKLLLVYALFAQVKEPYRTIHNGSFTGKKVLQSPDPLIAYQWEYPKASDALEIYTLQPKAVKAFPFSSFNLQRNKQKDQSITVAGKGSLLFDFGIESAAWLEFESDDLRDTVEMSISEYNEPAIVNAGAQNRLKTKMPVKYGNTYRLELNNELYEGVRFGWIHVHSFTKPWHIKNVKLICQVKPVNYKGSFWCNDTMLTRIWYTGAYTVKLNLLRDYFGAILMERSDRHSWTGDAYPSQAASLAAFGNYDLIKQNIIATSKEDNGIPAYSLYWVLSLIDYYKYTGDSAFLKEYTANAAARLDAAYKHYDSLPQLGFMGWDERLGAGFENPQLSEGQNTYRMLCIKTWKQFAQILQAGSNQSLAEKYNTYANEKLKQIQSTAIQSFGVHAVSEGISAGLADKSTHMLAHQLYTDKLKRLSYSPFNQYFIIQAMAAAGYHNEGISAVKDCWGGQIKYGGTSFFEVFRPSWNEVLHQNDAPPNNQCGYTSLAHPWSAGVTKWLSEEVLGVKPAQPGFKAFTIIPHLSAGVTKVRGEVPTPLGNIKASFDIITGNCNIIVPQNTIATIIALPKGGKNIHSIRINKELLYNKNFYSIKNIKSVQEDKEYVYLNGVLPGTYSIKIQYSGILNMTANSFYETWRYRIGQLLQDSTTSGDWQTKYGKEGYAFFGYSNGGNTYSNLPAYISKIETQKNGVVVWDSLNADKRSSNIANIHKATAIITKDPAATLQTMTIDVLMRDSLPHKLSLYFVDYDNRQRRSVIELFDLANLELLAPVQIVSNYKLGKYVSFTLRGSIRIRVNHVRGPNAAVSSLFFD